MTITLVDIRIMVMKLTIGNVAKKFARDAAAVEEATAASHALAQETGELARLIDQFQAGRGGAAAEVAAAAFRH